jgi:hypothetical protein
MVCDPVVTPTSASKAIADFYELTRPEVLNWVKCPRSETFS